MAEHGGFVRVSLVWLLAVSSACGDDDGATTAPDAGIDLGADAFAGDDLGAPDAAGDDDVGPADAGPLGCLDVLARDLEIEVDPDGRDGQIHASLAFGHETLWVVYAEPDRAGTGLFDVRARRFGCDGAPLGESIAVQASPEGNDVSPRIALVASGAVVVWVKDDGTGGTANLQVFSRSWSRDGTLGAPESRVATERDGMVVPDNHLDAHVASIGDGVLLAGARALPDVMRFQAFVQPLDGAGAIDGAASDVVVEPNVTHSSPSVAGRSRTDGWIAYERTDDGATEGHVMLARLDGAGGPSRIATELESTGSPSVALDATNPSRVWIAFAGEVLSGEIDVWIVDASAPEATRANVRLGERRALDYSPVIVADERGGGAVVWYRNTSGIRNELWAARFAPSDDGATLRASTPVLVATDVPPYAPAITRIAGDVFAVGYSVGTSPAFRLRARLVDLAVP